MTPEEIEGSQFQCEKCDNAFNTQNGLDMHDRRMHGTWGAGPRVKCKVCGQETSKSYANRHAAIYHYGLKEVPKSPSTTVNAVVPATVSTAPALIAQSTNRKPRFNQLDNFIILERDDGSLWLAEMIRE